MPVTSRQLKSSARTFARIRCNAARRLPSRMDPKAFAWTSDAKNRWGASWLEWNDFSRFWTQVVKRTIPSRTEQNLQIASEVDGATMAQSFRESIGTNYPAPAFAAELARMETYFQTHPVKRGDHIWLTYTPNVGLGQLHPPPPAEWS